MGKSNGVLTFKLAHFALHSAILVKVILGDACSLNKNDAIVGGGNRGQDTLCHAQSTVGAGMRSSN